MNYFIRIYLGLCCAIALLTACAKDDYVCGINHGKVTFEVGIPELATRYGEGTMATTLHYAIYDMTEETDNCQLVKCETIHNALMGLTATVSIDLVDDRHYSAIFWADAGAGSPYEFNAATKTVSYKDTSMLTANNEAYDAFFAHIPAEQIVVGGNITVTLTRPFAQLNIATDDYDENASNGIEVTHTALQIEAYTSFNLVTGEVVGNLQTLTFDSADIPLAADATIEVGGKPYRCLSMNYILVGSEEYMAEPILYVSGTKNSSEAVSFQRSFSDVSLKRNRRTNVVGSIINKNTN